MKKILSMLFVMIMTFSMGDVVFAANTIQNNTNPSFTVTYKLAEEIKSGENYPEGIVAPEQKFTYSFTPEKVEENKEITKEKMPEIPPVTVEFQGDDLPVANNPSKEKQGTIDITSINWPGVGVYYYKVVQRVDQEKPGVAYASEAAKEHTLKVTVYNDPNNSTSYAAFVTLTENLNANDGQGNTANKSNGFTNTYSANNLSVKKEVTGNMGDKDKEFEVDVTFKILENSETMASTISYGGENIAPSDWTERSVTKVIKLKHDDTVTFQNIPKGVEYTVKEHDYTTEDTGKYDTATYKIGEAATENGGKAIPTGKIGNSSTSVTITNNKGVPVDTGINMDNLPYILMLAFVIVSLSVLLVRRYVVRGY